MTGSHPPYPPSELELGELQPVSLGRWVAVWVSFAAGVAAAASQNQIPPMASLLQSFLQISPTVMGFIMSSFGIAGAVLGIPVGVLTGGKSAKKLAMVGLAALALGNSVPLAYLNPAGLVLGRIIGGVGFALVAVAAPSIVSASAPPDRRGLAMGLWAAWVPAGTITIFNLTPWLVQALSVKGVWAFCVILSLVALLAVSFLVVEPSRRSNPSASPPANAFGRASSDRRRVNLKLIYLSLAFWLFAATTLSVTTWLPTFLVQVRSLPLATANFFGSLASAAAIAGCPTAGWLYDRYRSIRAICCTGSAIQTALFQLVFHLPTPVVPAIQLMTGFVGSMVPTVIFAAIPQLARDKREVPLGLGLTLTAQNGGLIVGPTLTGWLLTATGSWDLVALAISLVCFVTAVMWLILPTE